MTTKQIPFEGSSVPGVYLEGGYNIISTKYGDSISYNNIDGIFEQTANSVLESPLQFDGEVLRFLRQLLNLTQGDLAKEVGKSVQAIAQWEKGQRPIPKGDARFLKLFLLAKMQPERNLIVPEWQDGIREDIVLHYNENGTWTPVNYRISPRSVINFNEHRSKAHNKLSRTWGYMGKINATQIKFTEIQNSSYDEVAA